ncbi:hypothetical protein IMCC1989_468 [gamma proteobacterium IMCC1989]|nr:hypothetical protein IMCC1989_468 [gamma proteobacterium IMCC1989]
MPSVGFYSVATNEIVKTVEWLNHRYQATGDIYYKNRLDAFIRLVGCGLG